MEKNRAEAFSDGVFAIVITLLILDIKLPTVDYDHLTMTIFKLYFQQYFCYILSFLIIGVYWVAHHDMFHYIRTINRKSLWLNLLTLLSVSSIPFPTALLGDYPGHLSPVIMYCFFLSCTNICGVLFWRYATHDNLYTVRPLKPAFRRFVMRVHLVPVFFYILAAASCLISYFITYFILICVPLFFILPNKWLDTRMRDAYLPH